MKKQTSSNAAFAKNKTTAILARGSGWARPVVVVVNLVNVDVATPQKQAFQLKF